MKNSIFDCYTTDENLDWLCIKCGMPNITASLLNTSSHNSTHGDSRETKKANRLRIFICNFQSLWNKKAELEQSLATNNIDVLIGSETHLACNIRDREIIPQNYQAFKQDRKDGYGGVIILAKKDLKIQEIRSSDESEIITIKIETFQKPVIVSACYKPPERTSAANDNLIKNINSICKKYSSNPIWIGGEFNLPDIQWDTIVVEGS